MLTFLLATRNRSKARELHRLIRGRIPSPIRLLTLDRFADFPSVKENGATFEANARKKAVETSRRTMLPVLAEDSGLEVFALGRRPGVRSARFSGPGQKDAANIGKLLRLMADVPVSKRQARFVCCLTLALGGRVVRTFRGTCSGVIALVPKGRGGFGYDPVFIPTGFRKTFAELSAGIKDSRSHRARAVRQFIEWLKRGLLKRLED